MLSLIDSLMIIYFLIYYIPSKYLTKMEGVEVFLPGIIFGICVFLLIKNIYKMPYLIGSTILVIWTLYSRYHLGKAISHISHNGHI